VNTNGTARPGPGIPTRLPILMYHEIGDRSQTSSPLVVTPGAFAEQLAYLHAAGYRTVTAGALPKVLAAGEPLDRTVVLTFDARTLLNREAPLCNAPASPW
jgi:hypothetical protein